MPVTATLALAVSIGIPVLKAIFSNTTWTFKSIESSLTSDALDLFIYLFGKGNTRRKLRKQLVNAGQTARTWLEESPEHKDIWPILKSACAEDQSALPQATFDLKSDLSGTQLRKHVQQIFADARVDEDLKAPAADAFFEGLLLALLQVPTFAHHAQHLLNDLSQDVQNRILRDVQVETRRLTDPAKLLIEPYGDLPKRDEQRLSELLIPKYGVVPFIGRDNEKADLLSWCRQEDGSAARLYLGPGGAGKTRFFAEVCSQLLAESGDEWRAGWFNLRRYKREPVRLDTLLESEGNVLIGVDYAGSEFSQVIGLANDIVEAKPAVKVRLVLFERDGGQWWKDLRAEAGTLFARAAESSLEPLGDQCPRQTVFETAVAAFQEILSKKQQIPDNIDLSGEEFSNVLFILMAAALAAAGDRTPTAAGILDRLLGHERKWRNGRAKALEFVVSSESLELAAALGTLVGGVAKKDDAFALLRRISNFENEQDHTLENVCRAIGGGGESKDSDRGYLPALKPDRLGERLLEKLFTPQTDEEVTLAQKVLIAVFPGEHSAFKHAGFLTLDRMARRDPKGQWFANLAATDLVYRLPEHTVELREFAALLTGLAAEIQPRQIKDETEVKSARARGANNLAIRLSALGRREEALDAAREAVKLYRELADARPDAFRPDLAASLNNLSIRLSALGRREEALDAAREAEKLYRELAKARPDAFRPDLAMSLNNLANVLSDLGRREEALDAAREAVDIRRELADARPDAFRPDLAMSLNNLANRLSDLGRREEALDAAREAAILYRELADAHPDAFRPNLAMALNNLVAFLSESDYREEAEEALDTAREAVDIRRELADARPDAFRPDLASSLNNLANCLSALGRREEALDAAREAVDIRRELADARPDAFQPDLATSLGALGSVHRAMENHEAAAAAFKEGLKIILPYLQNLPKAFRQNAMKLARAYVEACTKAKVEADETLLAQVAAVLETLERATRGIPKLKDLK
ncbi:MAG: tetratricopeptide repeat protein [Candidatus Lernaella stagnicola]|nr:tetratricopeptide repeat protein [Candidatus Lernaella stagnicola]